MIMPITQTAIPAPPRGSAEIDLELFTFVERYATTNLRLDLILWFGRNPDAELTADQVASALRRNSVVTTKELDDLTYLRVLVRRYTPERTTYRLTKRANVRLVAIRLAALEAMPIQVTA
jgi:hypothetical protein